MSNEKQIKCKLCGIVFTTQQDKEEHIKLEHGDGDRGGKISNDADNRVNFLLCPSCFWCASHLPSPMLRTMAMCPSCTKGNVESVPVAENEEYKFDYDIIRGVTMKFFR